MVVISLSPSFLVVLAWKLTPAASSWSLSLIMLFSRYVLLWFLLCIGSLHAQVYLHNESVGADLGDNYMSPTTLALSQGSSLLDYTVGEFDTDLLTLHIPLGLQLDSIILRNYQSTAVGNVSFIGFQSNRTTLSGFPFSGFSDQINYSLYGALDLNENLLPRMLQLGGSPAGPLQAGNYAFWMNETGTTSSAVFEFQSSAAIPEPDVALLGLFGLFVFSVRRRRM